MYVQKKKCRITPHNRTDDDSTNFQKLLSKEDYFMQPQNKGVLEVTISILNSAYCSRSATGSNQKQFPSQHLLKISERDDCQL